MNEIIRQRINALIPLLKDADPDVRTIVAHAIEHLEASSEIGEILQTLKNGDMGARISAIYALGEIGGEQVITPLVYCAGRPEDDIPRGCNRGVGTSGRAIHADRAAEKPERP